MNSMTNLPQLYQDIMRSPYAAAAAAAHFANTNNPSLSPSPLQKSYLNPTASQFMHPNHNPLAAAMVAQAQAVQKQQQLQHQQQNQTANFAQNFVNHMQQNLSQQHQLQLQQQTQQAFNAMFRPQMPSNNGQKPPFPFQNQKSLFQPKEGQIKSEFQINNGLSVDVQQQQQNDSFNQNRQRKKQNPVSTSMMYNNKPQTDKLKQSSLLNSSSNSNSSGLNRGRGRPPRRLDSITSKLNSTNSSLLSNDNEKYQTNSLNKSFSPSRTNSSASPAHSGSRSRSPRSPRMSKSPSSKKMDEDGGKNVTRTSTPSKFSSNQHETEIDEDDQNTDIYSSIYEGEDRGEEEVDEELDIDGEGDDPINEEDELNEDEDELNTTASTKSNRTSKSPLENGQVAKKRAQKSSPVDTNTPNPARPVYDFTMQALEMSLYGYLRQTDPMFVGHAISGLRMPPFGSAFNPLSLNQHLSGSLGNGLLSPKLAQNGLNEDAANQFSSALIKNRGWC